MPYICIYIIIHFEALYLSIRVYLYLFVITKMRINMRSTDYDIDVNHPTHGTSQTTARTISGASSMAYRMMQKITSKYPTPSLPPPPESPPLPKQNRIISRCMVASSHPTQKKEDTCWVRCLLRLCFDDAVLVRAEALSAAERAVSLGCLTGNGGASVLVLEALRDGSLERCIERYDCAVVLGAAGLGVRFCCGC